MEEKENDEIGKMYQQFKDKVISMKYPSSSIASKEIMERSVKEGYSFGGVRQHVIDRMWAGMELYKSKTTQALDSTPVDPGAGSVVDTDSLNTGTKILVTIRDKDGNYTTEEKVVEGTETSAAGRKTFIIDGKPVRPSRDIMFEAHGKISIRHTDIIKLPINTEIIVDGKSYFFMGVKSGYSNEDYTDKDYRGHFRIRVWERGASREDIKTIDVRPIQFKNRYFYGPAMTTDRLKKIRSGQKKNSSPESSIAAPGQVGMTPRPIPVVRRADPQAPPKLIPNKIPERLLKSIAGDAVRYGGKEFVLKRLVSRLGNQAVVEMYPKGKMGDSFKTTIDFDNPENNFSIEAKKSAAPTIEEVIEPNVNKIVPKKVPVVPKKTQSTPATRLKDWKSGRAQRESELTEGGLFVVETGSGYLYDGDTYHSLGEDNFIESRIVNGILIRVPDADSDGTVDAEFTDKNGVRHITALPFRNPSSTGMYLQLGEDHLKTIEHPDGSQGLYLSGISIRVAGVDTPEMTGGTVESRKKARAARDYVRMLFDKNEWRENIGKQRYDFKVRGSDNPGSEDDIFNHPNARINKSGPYYDDYGRLVTDVFIMIDGKQELVANLILDSNYGVVWPKGSQRPEKKK